jgi:hypothetical protein
MFYIEENNNNMKTKVFFLLACVACASLLSSCSQEASIEDHLAELENSNRDLKLMINRFETHIDTLELISDLVKGLSYTHHDSTTFYTLALSKEFQIKIDEVRLLDSQITTNSLKLDTMQNELALKISESNPKDVNSYEKYFHRYTSLQDRQEELLRLRIRHRHITKRIGKIQDKVQIGLLKTIQNQKMKEQGNYSLLLFFSRWNFTDDSMSS